MCPPAILAPYSLTCRVEPCSSTKTTRAIVVWETRWRMSSGTWLPTAQRKKMRRGWPVNTGIAQRHTRGIDTEASSLHWPELELNEEQKFTLPKRLRFLTS